MRPFVALLAFAGFIASCSAQSLPACAATCLASANLGGCVATDNACLCKNSAFVQSTTSCIESTCTGADLQAAEQAAQAICAAVGVTLSAPAASAPVASGSASSVKAVPSVTSAPAAASTTAAAGAPTNSAATQKSGAVLHGANVLVGAFAIGLGALAL